MAVTVYLALGSNKGDRRANIHAAIKCLAQHMAVEGCSSLYETEPAYITDQARFYNLVLRASTTLSPRALLHFVKQIEQQLGRITTVRFGPRVVDIDILLYDQVQIDEPDLVIPHPRIEERAFVLVPLAEIAPDLMLPGQCTTTAMLAQRADQQGKVIQIVPDPDMAGCVPQQSDQC
jgi:2-amino-4-hydroxy-6-hydroxymethyldihydropteridine diphosphokinase